MHKGLSDIVAFFGIPVSERSCHDDFVYDGKTIALNWQSETWDENFDNLLALSEPKRLPDTWIAHELAHWVVATPTEREFPEYGCTGGIVGYGSSAAPTGKDANFDGVLTEDEQDFRELCADMLGTYWCLSLGMQIPDDEHPAIKYNHRGEKHVAACWRAIIWLRENGFMPEVL